jgi:hypothetical protein
VSVKTVLDALKAHAGLSALVGGRIYRATIPQTPTYPLILFDATEEYVNTLAGKSSLGKWEYSFTCKSKSLSTMENLVTQLPLALQSSTFQPIIGEVVDDDFEDEQGIYTVSIDVSIWL